MITRKELREKYNSYFKARGYAEIPSFSLIPEHGSLRNPAVFTPAGVHPLIPYFAELQQPVSNKLINVQRSFRPGDIKEVGDTYHHSFFEMVGNFSFGQTSKKEFIQNILGFLTGTLQVPLERLGATIFRGNEYADRDYESIEACTSFGMKKGRIALSENYFMGPNYINGPLGPNNEFHYWRSNSIPQPDKLDPENRGWLEVGGFASFEYRSEQDEEGKFKEIKTKKIDFGFGLERLLAMVNKLEDNYLTDVFKPTIEKIEELSKKQYGANEVETKSMRIIADHVRASIFIASESITPSSMREEYIAKRIKRKPTYSQSDKYIGREYLLRLLLRKAVRHGKMLGIKNSIPSIARTVIETYKDCFQSENEKQRIIEVLKKEENEFLPLLEAGLGYMSETRDRGHIFSGENAYLMYDKYEFPIELIEEEAERMEFSFSREDFENEFRNQISKQKKIMIITSGNFYGNIPEVKRKLEVLGYRVKLPNSYGETFDKEAIRAMPDNEFAEFKGGLMAKNNENISAQDAVLVLNFDKNGSSNYIGGATFLEIYDAWKLHKKIFVYNNLPNNIFLDELRAMRPIVLNGNLQLIR